MTDTVKNIKKFSRLNKTLTKVQESIQGAMEGLSDTEIEIDNVKQPYEALEHDLAIAREKSMVDLHTIEKLKEEIEDLETEREPQIPLLKPFYKFIFWIDRHFKAQKVK